MMRIMILKKQETRGNIVQSQKSVKSADRGVSSFLFLPTDSKTENTLLVFALSFETKRKERPCFARTKVFFKQRQFMLEQREHIIFPS